MRKILVIVSDETYRRLASLSEFRGRPKGDIASTLLSGSVREAASFLPKEGARRHPHYKMRLAARSRN